MADQSGSRMSFHDDPRPRAAMTGESESWRGFRRRRWPGGRPFRFGRGGGRYRRYPWASPYGQTPAPMDTAGADADDSGGEGFLTLSQESQPEFQEVYGESEQPGESESERRFRRRRIRRRGSSPSGVGGPYRRRPYWTARGPIQPRYNFDEPDSGDGGDDGDAGDGGEVRPSPFGPSSELLPEASGEAEGESESRGYRGYRGSGYRTGRYAPGYGYRSPYYRGAYGARYSPSRANPYYGRRSPYLTGYRPRAWSRWPWLYRTPYRGAVAPAASPWIVLVQRCLRRLLGPGVPVDGVLGAQTRRSIRAFQRQRGLPGTGMLDNITVQTLQAACVAPSAPPFPPPMAAAPPPDFGPPEPPPAEPPGFEPPPPDAGPPDAGAEPPPDAAGGPPPGDEPQGEVLDGHREGQTEQEFLVNGPTRVDVVRRDPTPLGGEGQFAALPDAPGLYVIYVGSLPWYVGIAEVSIRQRFMNRRKVLNDLRLPPSALANRSVACYVLRSGSVGRGTIQRREQGNPSASFRPVPGKYAVLRILEQYYIKRLRRPKGNELTEAVRFGPRGSFTIAENGVTVAEFPPNSQM